MLLNEMQGSAKKHDYPLAKAGVQPARIVHVVDLGVQKREWQGEVKTPARQLFINIELVNDEYEVNGEKRRQRVSPRPFNVLTDEKAALTKFLKSIDPANAIAGDLTKLANLPIMASVIHNKRVKNGQEVTYANYGGGLPAPEGFPIKELLTPALVFSYDEPTAEAYKELPNFLKDKIKAAVNFTGSKVETIVKAVEAAEKKNEAF